MSRRGRPAGETTPFHPKSPHAVAKAAAHWLVVNYRDAYGIHACNGILFNHESPLRPARFVTKKIAAGAFAIEHGERPARGGVHDDVRGDEIGRGCMHRSLGLIGHSVPL